MARMPDKKAVIPIATKATVLNVHIIKRKIDAPLSSVAHKPINRDTPAETSEPIHQGWLV